MRDCKDVMRDRTCAYKTDAAMNFGQLSVSFSTRDFDNLDKSLEDIRTLGQSPEQH